MWRWSAEDSGADGRVRRSDDEGIREVRSDIPRTSSDRPWQSDGIPSHVRIIQRLFEHIGRHVQSSGGDGHGADEVDEYRVRGWSQPVARGEGVSSNHGSGARLLEARKINPRAWLCLKGWRRMCFAKLKCPHGWATWAAIAYQLCKDGHFRLAVMVVIMVAGYLRAREGLSITMGQFLPPSNEGLPCWTLLLFPGVKGLVSKTGETDDTVPIGQSAHRFHGRDTPQLYSATPDPELVQLQLHRILPHLHPKVQEAGSHHSAVARATQRSVDRSSVESARPVGGAKDGALEGSKISSALLKRGRINQSWAALTDAQRETFSDCQVHLSGAMCRKEFPVQTSQLIVSSGGSRAISNLPDTKRRPL